MAWRDNPLYPFLGKVLLWLPLCFAAWYFAVAPVTWPAARLSQFALSLATRADVESVTLKERKLDYAVAGQAADARGKPRRALVDVEVAPMVYSYGIAVLVALVLAASPGLLRALTQLAIGVPVLWLAQAWSLSFDVLKQLALTPGAALAQLFPFNPTQRELIAFGYQFGTLILPSVTPLVVWVLLNRRVVQAVMLSGAIDAEVASSQKR